MMRRIKKSKRQALIKELIHTQAIRKQEEFVVVLNEQGIEVTQATISRDIQELKLVKVSHPDGFFYYSLSCAAEVTTREKLVKLLREAVLTYDQMEKFVVLKTMLGKAKALGILLEEVYLNELFTLITTEDKVLMIFKEEKFGKKLSHKLSTLIYG